MKKKTIPQLKKKLWELTSKFVRLRDSDDCGYATCVTCNACRPWQEIHAGHFIARAQGNATAWDLRNIHAQCFRCNINLGGNGAEYYPYMLKRYGEDVVSELRRLSKTTRKITRAEYAEMIDEMATKLAKLLGEKKIIQDSLNGRFQQVPMGAEDPGHNGQKPYGQKPDAELIENRRRWFGRKTIQKETEEMKSC
jgi:hypothetical protein